MARFVKGDVITELEGDDLILCQITSQRIRDRYAVSIEENDFETGTLRQKSNVRPNRIFTADRHIVLYRVGYLKPDKVSEVSVSGFVPSALRPNPALRLDFRYARTPLGNMHLPKIFR